MADKCQRQNIRAAARERRQREARIARELRRVPVAPLDIWRREYDRAGLWVPGPEVLVRLAAWPLGGLTWVGRVALRALRPLPLALAGTAAVAGAMVVPGIGPILDTVAETRACSLRTGIYDSDGRLVHALAPSATACLIASVPIRDPDHRQKLKQAILITEGEVAGIWAPLGQNIKGLARRALAAVGWTNGPRGATGPAQSVFELMAGQPNGLPLRNKLTQMAAGAWFFATEATTGDARLDLIIDIMPMTKGGGQHGLAGELGLRALWGEDGQPDTLARICVTTRAMAFQVDIENGVHGERAALWTWARALGPSAAHCVVGMAADAAAQQAALAELDAMCGDSTACRLPFDGLPPGIVGEAREKASEDRMIAAVARTGGRPGAGVRRSTLPPATAVALADAARLAAPGTPLVTTLDIGAGRALNAALPGILDELLDQTPAGACFRGDCAPQVPGLDYEITLSELIATGPVARVVATSVHGGLFGPTVTQGEKLVPGEPLFGEASVQKAILALVAARHGVTRVCPGASDATALSSCRQGAAISVAEAIATSQPAAFIAIARAYPNDVRALQDALGMVGGEHLDAAYGAAYGIGRVMTAAQVHTLFGAIYGGGRASGLALFQDAPVGPDLDLAALGYSTNMLSQVQDWLAQPLQLHKGTLVDLQAALPRIDIIGGKSGTHEEGDSRLKIAAALVLNIDQKFYVLTFAIWSPRGGLGLGGLRHRHVAPLVAATVQALRDHPSP